MKIEDLKDPEESGVDYLRGEECTPGDNKEEDGKKYFCNDRGKWKKERRKRDRKKRKLQDPAAKRIQEDIDRLFG